MFLVLQLPFTDSRPFLPIASHRLLDPVWASPREDKDFVRSFGEVKRRLRGGLGEWPTEGFYCCAERALRFDASFAKRQLIDESLVPVRKFCAFRRFLADGCAVARVEIGVKYRSRGKDLRFTGDQCLGLIRSLLSQRVTVPFGGDQQSGDLLSVHQKLSRLYLKSSTAKVSCEAVQQNWWFAPGNPLLVLEYIVGTDVKELPKYTRSVQSEILTDAKISLSHARVRFRGREVGTWLLGVTPHETDPIVLRSLRLNLLRFHAEMESIRQIFRLIVGEKIVINRGTAASDKLQKHMQDSICLLSRESREGLPQSKILDVARQFDELINTGDRESLLLQLSAIRRNYFRSVDAFTQSKGVSPVEPRYDITAETVILIDRSRNMTKQSQNIYGNVTGNINQVAAKTIQDSFNTIAEAEISGALKGKLEELGGAVTEMAKNLPETKQKKVAQDYKSLTDEVTSEEPRKEWYELSAKGLMNAAKTVGEIAMPVITVVKSILALLA
jgi:hypothetical protein